MPYIGDTVQAQLERCQRRFRVLRATLSATRRAKTPEEAVNAFLSEVCTGFGWPAGLYLARADAESTFVPTSLRFPAEGPNQHLLRALHERSRLENGSNFDVDIHRAGVPRWIPNVTLEPSFEAAKQAVALGVRGLVGIPFEGRGRIYGVAEFFTREEFNPSPDQIDYLADLGRIVGTVVHFYEMDRRRLRSRQEQEIVFEQILDPVYIIDRSGRATFANEPAARLFGVSQDKLRGKHIHDDYHRTMGAAPQPWTDCPLHGAGARTMQGVRRRETFRTEDDRHVEVEAVAAPLLVNGTDETVVLLRVR